MQSQKSHFFESRIVKIEYPKTNLFFYLQFIISTESLKSHLKEFFHLFFNFWSLVDLNRVAFPLFSGEQFVQSQEKQLFESGIIKGQRQERMKWRNPRLALYDMYP